ncbi:MAG TPA: hypothetical protein DCK83_10980 [Gallionellaceae bacterium]|nr:hypothetical protein [Gallionellaceae bacterium]
MHWDTDLSGLAGITLAVFALLLRQRRVQALPWPQRMAVLLAVLLVLLVPVAGLSLAGLLRGITGDLSILTLLFLLLASARTLSGCGLVLDENRARAVQAIAIAALLFYPLVLGLGSFDPYRLGYGNLWFMLALLGFAAWAALRHSILLALGIALAVAAWSIGWYESPNLWDYLLDPWLGIYALAAQVRHWWKQRRGTVHVQPEP